MMGPSHALSGAAVWLAGSWALNFTDVYHQGPLEIAVGTAVCAGAALLPDLDMSGKVTSGEGGATIAQAFGRVSLFVAEVLEKFCTFVYFMTRMRDDPRRENGHRTLTHTLPFAIAVGWATMLACTAGGKWTVMGILFVMVGLALRGLFHTWARKRGWILITLVSAAATYGAYVNLPPERGYPMLGVAVGVGCLVHLLGDVITSAGVPIVWPIPTGRRMWRMIGVPNALAVRVGGKVETIVLRGLFTIIALAATVGIVGPTILEKFDIQI
jgi:membrane-bound metal-dependent hydrolase YbcI (DUF457 family)